MIFQFDTATHPVWILFQKFGLSWVVAASLLVSGLVSWWLAIMVVRPIRYLASASSRQGEGDFDTLIEEGVLGRRDEIGELARQLHTSGLKIRNLLNQQRDFLRDVSHEVRTPLARLQIAAETVELDASDQRALGQIKQQVGIIDQLVQDLLHLSRFDQPATPHVFEDVNAGDLIARCLESARMLSTAKNVKLVRCIQCERAVIPGVAYLLERALDNLLTNAIRHTPEHSTIRIECRLEEDDCCIDVCDEGDGVPEESLAGIFEPFVRLDYSRQRHTGGFGLGLPLVCRIVALHEGSVSASNMPTGFVVKLQIPLERNV